jgi:hypothetical protein
MGGAYPRCMGRTIGRGGPARGSSAMDSCVLDCCEAWIATRGCVSFCGSDRIFPFIVDCGYDHADAGVVGEDAHGEEERH